MHRKGRCVFIASATCLVCSHQCCESPEQLLCTFSLKMSSVIRGCNPRNFPLFFEIDSHGKTGGFYSSLVDDLLDHVHKMVNSTLEARSENDGIGNMIDEKTGMYDGCIGRLQRNDSDVMTQLANYAHPADHLNQGLVFVHSVIQFISTYKTRSAKEVKPVQVESMFNSFNSHVWLLCLVTLLAGSTTLALRHFLLRQASPSTGESDHSDQPVYEVATHMIGYGCVKATGPSANVLSISLSIFTGVVLLYICSFIKTELVALRPPDTLRSYQDLLDKNVSLAFLKGWDTFLAFKSAHPDTMEGKLWNLTVQRYPKMDFMFQVDSGFIWAVRLILQQKMTVVTDSTVGQAFMRNLCKLFTQESIVNIGRSLFGLNHVTVKSIFPLYAQDETAEDVMKGVLFSESFKGFAYVKIRRGLTCFMERGLVLKAAETLKTIDATKSILEGQEQSQTSGLVEECSRNILYEPTIKIESVGFGNIQNLVVITMSLYLLALYCFVYEMSFFSQKQRRTRSSH